MMVKSRIVVEVVLVWFTRSLRGSHLVLVRDTLLVRNGEEMAAFRLSLQN
jgi:hypothetical protein